MGAYFAATGLGNFVAGSIGEQIKNYTELQLFTGVAIFCVIFGALVLLILKPFSQLKTGRTTVFDLKSSFQRKKKKTNV